MLSPLGISIIAAVIVAISSLIYWKRKSIKKWLAGKKIGVTFKTPIADVSIEDKEKPKQQTTRASAGVSFGEGNDFTGAKISGVAGRDIRRGAAAAETSGGKTPGVDFGKKGKFRNAEIEDVAGRDIVED
jgi:hypothetical protein